MKFRPTLKDLDVVIGDVLDRKEGSLDYQKVFLRYSKNLQFSKGVTHDFNFKKLKYLLMLCFFEKDLDMMISDLDRKKRLFEFFS